MASFASRREISVLPTPVGPIIRMFFGSTSSRISSSSCWRRQRLRKRDGDGALGIVLADDEAVEFGDDFARREGGHGGPVTKRERVLMHRLAPKFNRGRTDFIDKEHVSTYPVRMTNLTLSIEDDVLRAARKLAAERETTVNAMVREYLSDQVAQRKRVRCAIERMNAIADEAGAVVGPVTWTRDELHER